MQSASPSRRTFFALSLVALSSLMRVPQAFAHHRRTEHPTPRPGIDASRVLQESELGGDADAIIAFNEVRQIPHIIDGIRCYCGCAGNEGYYSLLTCYERPDGMAKWCDKCQGQGRYTYRLHRAGKSLAEIRAAIDDRYA